MIFVSGASGLVGSHLLLELVNKKKQVRALYRNKTSIDWVEKIFSLYCDNSKHLCNQIEWIKGDVLDIDSLEHATEGVSEVYHCAAIVSFIQRERYKMMQVNAVGTANMVNAALQNKVKRFCYVSSVAALGRNADVNEIDESSDWVNSSNNSRYAESKYIAEREVWRGFAEGLNGVIVNPSIIIGVGDPAKSSARLLAQVHKGNRFYTNGVNSFVDVIDVVRAMIMLMESNVSNERFVLSGDNCSYKQIFDLIADGFAKPRPSIEAKKWMLELLWRFEYLRNFLTGSTPLITKETSKTSMGKHYYSSRKIVETLGFNFTPIAVSIQRNCQLYQKLISP